MSFTVVKIAARTCFSKALCPLRPRKLPRSLVFRGLDVIYGPEKLRAHLFFEDSMPFTVRKIAAHSWFSKARCHLRSGKLPHALVFEGSTPFLALKIAAGISFSKARCHFRCGKLPRALLFRRFDVILRFGKSLHAYGFRRLDAIYSLENCHAHLVFEGSTPFTVR